MEFCRQAVKSVRNGNALDRGQEEESVKIYDENGKLTGVACNCCGQIIMAEHGVLKEDVISIRKDWGYFSDKDGITHYFDLCEKCYDRMIKNFQIPVKAQDTVELI